MVWTHGYFKPWSFTMKRFQELSGNDQQKIRTKLDELRNRTGKSFAYDIVPGQGGEHVRPTLSIIVDGRCHMQAEIPKQAGDAADFICAELEKAVGDNENQLSARAATTN